MKKIIIGISIVVVIVGGWIWYMAGQQAAAPAPLPPGDSMPAPSDTTPGSGDTTPVVEPTSTATRGSTANTRTFIITAQNYSFTPATMVVKKRDRVRVTLKNVGGFHDLKIDEFGVATKRIGDGGEDTVQFTADTAGTFEFYCSVNGHREMGMKGMLTVEE